MRTSWWIGCFVVGASASALANTRVVVMTGDPAGEQALQISVAGRGAELVDRAVPVAELRFDRAAIVQHAVQVANASAGVWIESDPTTPEVYVVSADGKLLRHAPLPTESTPRMFAAIATSLLDEVLTGGDTQVGEPAQVNVDVRVDITTPPGVTVTQQLTQSSAPPAVITPMPPSVVIAARPPVAVVRAIAAGDTRDDHTLLEIGMMASTFSFGFEGGVMLPVTSRWRFGLIGGAGSSYHTASHPTPYYAGGEIRHVGEGSGHWDVGVFGGAGSAEWDSGGVAALRLTRAQDYDRGTFRATVSPAVLFTTYTAHPTLAVWASLLWAFEV